jgi:hypothetical protein
MKFLALTRAFARALDDTLLPLLMNGQVEVKE